MAEIDNAALFNRNIISLEVRSQNKMTPLKLLMEIY